MKTLDKILPLAALIVAGGIIGVALEIGDAAGVAFGVGACGIALAVAWEDLDLRRQHTKRERMD